MRRERKTLLNSEQIMNTPEGMATKRDGMLIEKRADAILDEIINLRAKSKTLPITMRKLYSYKIVEINQKQKEKNKVIPLVLRKRALFENAITG